MTDAEVRERRKSLGLTQRQLAERLGCTQPTVALWESHRHAAPPMLDLALRWLEHEQAKSER